MAVEKPEDTSDLKEKLLEEDVQINKVRVPKKVMVKNAFNEPLVINSN